MEAGSGGECYTVRNSVTRGACRIDCDQGSLESVN